MGSRKQKEEYLPQPRPNELMVTADVSCVNAFKTVAYGIPGVDAWVSQPSRTALRTRPPAGCRAERRLGVSSAQEFQYVSRQRSYPALKPPPKNVVPSTNSTQLTSRAHHGLVTCFGSLCTARGFGWFVNWLVVPSCQPSPSPTEETSPSSETKRVCRLPAARSTKCFLCWEITTRLSVSRFMLGLERFQNELRNYKNDCGHQPLSGCSPGGAWVNVTPNLLLPADTCLLDVPL